MIFFSKFWRLSANHFLYDDTSSFWQLTDADMEQERFPQLVPVSERGLATLTELRALAVGVKRKHHMMEPSEVQPDPVIKLQEVRK